MNRRDFLTVVSGAGVASLAGFRPAFAAEQTTNLYLSGLLMLSFEDPVLRIGFPRAPGHKATMKVVPVNGSTRTIPIRGNGFLETSAAANGHLRVAAPELVRISEIYGPDAKANFAKCPIVLDVPYAAIKSI